MRRRPSNSLAEEEDDDETPLVKWSLAKEPGEAPTYLRSHTPDGSSASEKRRAAASPATSVTDRQEEGDHDPPEIDGTGETRPDHMIPLARRANGKKMHEPPAYRRPRMRSPWACSLSSLLMALLGAVLVLVTVQSFVSRQVDVKGCRMSYMRPGFAKFNDFDTEHTRFASKYSLYLYREGGIDEDTRVNPTRSPAWRAAASEHAG